MDLKTLRERGAFAPAAPVPHEVSWTHPDENGNEVTDTFTVHVVKHSAGSVERLRARARSDAGSVQQWTALLISESIGLGEDGSERLSVVDADRLDFALANVLVDAINAVNGTGATAPKN